MAQVHLWGRGWVEPQSNPAHYTTCTHAQHTHTYMYKFRCTCVLCTQNFKFITYSTDTLHILNHACTAVHTLYKYHMYMHLYMYDAETFWPGYPPTSFPPPTLFTLGCGSPVVVFWKEGSSRVARSWASFRRPSE